MTTDGGANIVLAVSLCLSTKARVPCMAHTLNLVVDSALGNTEELSTLVAKVKGIVSYFKHSVSAADDLRREQMAEGKKEGDTLMLIQSVSTRWNSTLDMLVRFNLLATYVAKILMSRNGAPDMIPASSLTTLKEIVQILKPFKEATEEVSGDSYITASLVIPLSHLIIQKLENTRPTSLAAENLCVSLLEDSKKRFKDLEKNPLLARAMLLDPRFKKIHFSSPQILASTITALSREIHRGHDANRVQNPAEENVNHVEPPRQEESIWAGHEELMRSTSAAGGEPLGTLPSELKQFFDQPISTRKTNPAKYWLSCQSFTPVLAKIALDSLLPQGSSVSSERVASTVNLVVPNNRSRLTGENVEKRVFLTSLPDKYW